MMRGNATRNPFAGADVSRGKRLGAGVEVEVDFAGGLIGRVEEGRSRGWGCKDVL